MNTIYDGFNVDSIKKRYDPNYMKRFMAEMMIKKKDERVKKENDQLEKAGISRVFLQKEQPDSQKKRPEEDFENKKLLPVLEETYQLIKTIEGIRNDINKQIKNIQKSQKTLKVREKSFSKYKKAQTMVDTTREKILYKTIMCPLREKCGKVKTQRWPTSNTKSFTKFGEECPYAHHPMELTFPESILTQKSSNASIIKSLQKSIERKQSKPTFIPAGRLFECTGCSQRCNLCAYKKLAGDCSKKFIDKKRKESLMRSMERHESIDVRKEREEMSAVRK
mmetsp:Transcript_25437/g.19187  ORF Transcript_25437/g.19187 Transcript_25437/m.19187 type:complete len:279 (+) Transcript_25437:580-1416(+)